MRNDYLQERDWFVETFCGSILSFEELSDGFYLFIERLIISGWQRNDVYILIRELKEIGGFQELLQDIINEFDTALTGFCAAESVVRFPGDLNDPDELLKYVRSNVWRTPE